MGHWPLTAGVGAALAGCENTTTPVAAAGAGAAAARASSATRPPAARSTAPASRSRAATTRSRCRGSATPVKSSAKPERGGELQIYNYADYLNPAVLKAFGKQEGVSVRVTTFDTLDEAFSKLSTGGLEFDVIFSTPDQLSRLVGRQLIQPLNFELIPNLQKNVWPELHSPFYDVGPRYSVPYTTYTTGIAWRNDLLDFDPSKIDQPWDAFWTPQAEKYRGKVAILDDSREAPGHGAHAPRRDRPQHRGPRPARARRRGPQGAQRRVGVKVSIADYETVPAGRVVLHQGWSGDMIAGVISYMPKGVKPDVLSYWYQKQGGPIFNDSSACGQGDQAGHRAPLPQLPARQQGRLRELRRLRGLPAAADRRSTPSGSSTRASSPRRSSEAVVTREAYANGNAYLTLSAKGLQLWDRAWAAFRNG